jgi:glutaminyl-tRNA synthetase
MPTLVAARRRGYPPEAFRKFVDSTGASKSDAWIDYSVFEQAIRDHLNEIAPRRVAVLDPLRLVIDNLGADQTETCIAPNHPQHPGLGTREMPLTRELFIEREDFMEEPTKGFFRLAPGGRVRLKYGFVAEYVRHTHGPDGRVDAVHVRILEDSKSGTPGADQYKVKGVIHWVSAAHAVPAEVRLFDRLFICPTPGARREGDAPDLERHFMEDLNPNSLTTISALLEPCLDAPVDGQALQFERHGYFVPDAVDSRPGRLVFNRTVTLKS